MRPRITTEQRRRRMAVRHHLARPSSDLLGIVDDQVGLHSSDPASVYLSARARFTAFRAGTLEEALYEDRSLLRLLGMRGTLFVVGGDLAATMTAACAQALAPRERRRLVRLIEDQGLSSDGDAWLDAVTRDTLAALATRGEATATELSGDVPDLTLRLSFGEGTTWAASVAMSTRVLFLLAAEGRVVRTRPRGSWRSGQYRWAALDSWVPGGLTLPDPEDARRELARRWLRSYGPGTERDLAWWTGWTKTQTRAALGAVGAVAVDLAGPEGIGVTTGLVLPDDLPGHRSGLGDDPADAEPWVALLPSLDPTVMGWKDREWYVGDLAPRLFDRNGNAGPTVAVDGRMVGAWTHRSDGEIAVRILTDIGSAALAQVERQAAGLQEWLGAHRVTTRFPSPLERELKA